jgi:transposase InsO family protein
LRQSTTAIPPGSPDPVAIIDRIDRLLAIDSVLCVSITHTECLAEAGIAPPVGSVGDSFGNVLAATVIGLFKAEVIRRLGPWRSREAVDLATLALVPLLTAAASLEGVLRCRSQRVDWFNHRRLLEPTGNVPPAEAEATSDAEPESTPLVASD